MTIDEINEQRKLGDIARVHELSGIPYKTIEHILNKTRSCKTKRGEQVIEWFTRYIENRELLNKNKELI